MFSISGVNSESRLVAKMASFFPTAANAIDAEITLHQINSLTKENLYKMASKTAQVKLASIKRILCSIVDEKAPDWGHAPRDDVLKPVLDRFKHFMRATEVLADNKATIHTGRKAMQIISAKMKQSSDAGTKLTKTDVARLETFLWLVKNDERAPFNELIQKAEDAAIAKLKTVKKERGSGKMKKDKAVSEAASMFV